MVILVLLVMAGLFVGVPTTMWLTTLPYAERRWQPHQIGTQHVGGGSYRDTEVPRFSDSGPPRVVHLAAMGSWILGAMFVPGLLAGLVGLLAAGIGAVSIPGLILAWRLFFLGAPLLRGDPDAPMRARGAATFARTLNAVVLTICGIACLTQLPRLVRGGQSNDALGVMMFAAAVAFYAVVSIVHARLLDRAADLIDEKEGAFLSGVRVVGGSAFEAELASAEAVEAAAPETDADRAARRE
ncbi:MAG: hypothetical protein U0326_17805 [Polyangiales bacterium]